MLHQVPSRGGLIEYELHDPRHRRISPASCRARLPRRRGDRHAGGAQLPGIDVRAPAATGPKTSRPAWRARSASCDSCATPKTDSATRPASPGVDHDAFREALTKNPLPCLWRTMAVEYRQRLIGLRNSGYLKTVDASLVEQAALRPSSRRGRGNAGDAGAALMRQPFRLSSQISACFPSSGRRSAEQPTRPPRLPP